jgi:hypothetical protein
LKPNFQIGLHGIASLILQRISSDLVGQTDAAPFLMHVNQHTAALLIDLAQ